MAARTPEEARAVLAAMKGPGDIPLWHARNITTDTAIGKVYALSGRHAEAIPYLKSAAGACDVLSDPMAHTQAYLYLGIAHGDAGDKPEACRALDVVVRRWGQGGAESVTAFEARKRARGLGCESGHD